MATRPDRTAIEADHAPSPLGGMRAQALQRVQVGLSLLVGIILVVGLANVIEERAKQVDQASVPQAAATVEPTAAATPAVDPLADAGVVPDMPASPTPVQTPGASAAPAPPGAR